MTLALQALSVRAPVLTLSVGADMAPAAQGHEAEEDSICRRPTT